MPSSLIIVAIAAAWLVVLVPMVARKRSEVARTGDDALASRVVRSGSGVAEEREESRMPESIEEDDRAEPMDDATEASMPVADEHELDAREPEAGHYVEDEAEHVEAEPRPRWAGYRPGRGGFDPEAAEGARPGAGPTRR
jgi:hypothetical protein